MQGKTTIPEATKRQTLKHFVLKSVLKSIKAYKNQSISASNSMVRLPSAPLKRKACKIDLFRMGRRFTGSFFMQKVKAVFTE